MKIIVGNITRMKVDAIVNAANSNLLMGGGVCGAIFKAAGAKELQAECNKKAPIATGEAVITKGYKLPAKYIIHAVGPVYDPTRPDKSERELRSAYLNALELAEEYGLKSIAFPLISSGIYGYPPAEALEVAKETIDNFTKDVDMEVYMMIYNPQQ